MRSDWTVFYKTLAKKIGSHDSAALYVKIKALAEKVDFLGYMRFENPDLWEDRGHALDPFSVMAIFNRGQTDAHRERIAQTLAETFEVNIAPPVCFHGIPYIDPRRSVYDDAATMRKLYDAAQDGPEVPNFASAFDAAIHVHGNGLGTLSIGLYWILPDKFIAVDRVSSPYILDTCQLVAPEGKCSGSEYQEFMAKLKVCAARKGIDYPEITYLAWQSMHEGQSC